MLGGFSQEAMRGKRVRGPPNPLETKIDAFTSTHRAHRFVDSFSTLCSAKLGLDISLALNTLRRHCWVQLKGTPAHDQLWLGPQRQRARETTLAHIAPRADGIRKDVELHAAMLEEVAWAGGGENTAALGPKAPIAPSWM